MYSRDWLKRYPWVKETDNKHKAHCRACNKDIDVAQIGESALRSHASGDRHKKHEQSLSGTFTTSLSRRKLKLRQNPLLQNPPQVLENGKICP